MITLLKIFKHKVKPKSKLEKKLINNLGFKPIDISLYKQAPTHKSTRVRTTHNERLEFLGDAFIGSVVAEYVFREYPLANEGFLTQTRSKIVSRNTLNDLAIKFNDLPIVHVDTYSNPNQVKKDFENRKLNQIIEDFRISEGQWLFIISDRGMIIAKFQGYASFDQITEYLD